MGPEDNPADEVQPTEEEWEEYVNRESVYCPACSKAGGANMPIYHLPPACSEDSRPAVR
jgi:hypothetical protein